MNPIIEQELMLTRRQFFGHSGLRVGGIALAGLMAGGLPHAMASQACLIFRPRQKP
jgi:hypothetical protein